MTSEIEVEVRSSNPIPAIATEELKVKSIEIAVLFTLSTINGICYLDRYLTGALLPLLQDSFNIQDIGAGLLYATFAITYTIFYPICVFLAQYYLHRRFLRTSCLLWIVFSACSGLCYNFYLFTFMRILVAACHATYEAVSLQVMSKIAGKYPKQGSIWLRVYQMTGHFGVGCGFIMVAGIMATEISWRYCFCLAPILLLLNLPVLFIARVSENPFPFLASIVSDHLVWSVGILHEIYGAPTEVLATIGSICAGFYICSLYFWLPSCLFRNSDSLALQEVNLIIGCVISITSLAGILLGILLSQIFYKYFNMIDSIVCGFSLFMTMPLMATALYYSSSNIFLTTIFFSASQLIFTMHIPLVVEMLLYVVPPPKRIFASTVHTVFVNLFGDAASAFFVGIFSTWLSKSQPVTSSKTVDAKFLQYALCITTLLQLFGGVFFFLSAFFVARDRQRIRSTYPVHDRNFQPRYKRAFITVRSLNEM